MTEATGLTMEKLLKAKALLDAADVEEKGRTMRCLGKHLQQLRADAGAPPLDNIIDDAWYEAQPLPNGNYQVFLLVFDDG